MGESNPKSANPLKSGYCDFIFGRPCESPWKSWPESAQYVKGYLDAKENGVQVLHANNTTL